MVEYPEIQVVDGVYRLWYCGNGFGTVGYAEGRAESGVEVWLRSGEHAQPDGGWSGWRRVRRRRSVDLRRYVQVRVENVERAREPGGVRPHGVWQGLTAAMRHVERGVR